jgi:hypothetical protein
MRYDSLEINAPTYDSLDVNAPTYDSLDVNAPTYDSLDVNSPTYDSLDVNSPTYDSLDVNAPTYDSLNVVNPTEIFLRKYVIYGARFASQECQECTSLRSEDTISLTLDSSLKLRRTVASLGKRF